jgi:hypothetical protein
MEDVSAVIKDLDELTRDQFVKRYTIPDRRTAEQAGELYDICTGF